MTTHEKLIALLDQHQARYRLMEHEATGKCEAVAAIRGTEIGQGAKALVCHVKGNGVNSIYWRFYLPIIRPIWAKSRPRSEEDAPHSPVRRKPIC